MKRILTILAVMTMVLAACTQKQERLRNGDLVFVGLPVGYIAETGSIDEAIASATAKD